jgi:uncharacterized protein YndB with AHSA1/START domain
MTKIRTSVLIAAPLERVFEYLDQPEKLPEVWPSMLVVSNVQRRPDGGYAFDWTYKMAGIRFKGHSDTTEYVRNQRIVTESHEGIESRFDWQFSAEGEGTRLICETQYSLPSSLLDKLAERFLLRSNEREAQTVLDNIKSRLETTAGRVSRPSQREARA